VLAAVDPTTLQDTCGTDPSWICEKVLSATGSTGWAKAADFVLSKPLHILIIIVVALILNGFVRRAIRRFADTLSKRSSFGSADVSVRTQARVRTVEVVLRSTSSVVILGSAALIVLAEIGINLAPLIAGAGIVGIGIGFGAQSLVSDIITGFFMLVEDQYGVGDVVDVGEASGTVEAVTLRTTRLRDENGTVWYVPNGEIKRVGNKSQQWARAVVDVVVAHGTDLTQATNVLLETAAALRDEDEFRDALIGDPEVWGVENIDVNGITLRVAMKTQPAQQFRVMRELRARLNQGLTATGIRVPMMLPAAPAAPAVGTAAAPTPPPAPGPPSTPGDSATTG
jgi:small conductance mechanosensitive channel